MEQKLLTVKETADMLRLSKANVYNLAQSGRIGCVKIGKRRLFLLADIDQFITDCASIK